MKLIGRPANPGQAEAEAIVLDVPFAFTGDFDPGTGVLTIKGHPLEGKKIANKILVIPFGKGAVNAATVLYSAHKKGSAPVGIICDKADPITLECAMTVGIPIIDSFDSNPVDVIQTGDYVKITGEGGLVIVERKTSCSS